MPAFGESREVVFLCYLFDTTISPLPRHRLLPFPGLRMYLPPLVRGFFWPDYCGLRRPSLPIFFHIVFALGPFPPSPFKEDCSTLPFMLV